MGAQRRHEVHWRTITRDNVTSVYGGTSASRIADPDNEQRVYEWLLQETFDATGNHILYEYAQGQPTALHRRRSQRRLDAIFEHNRERRSSISAGSITETCPIRSSMSTGIRSHIPTEQRSGIFAKDAGTHSKSCSITAIGRSPRNMPHPGPLPAGEQELFGPDPSTSAEHNPVPVRDDRFSTSAHGFDIRTLAALPSHPDVPPLRRARRPDTGPVYRFRLSQQSRHPPVFPPRCHRHRLQKGCGGRLPISQHAPGHVQVLGVPAARATLSVAECAGQRPAAVWPSTIRIWHWSTCSAMACRMSFRAVPPDFVTGGISVAACWTGRDPCPRFLPASRSAQPGVGFGDMGGDGQADLLVHSGPTAGLFRDHIGRNLADIQAL